MHGPTLHILQMPSSREEMVSSWFDSISLLLATQRAMLKSKIGENEQNGQGQCNDIWLGERHHFKRKHTAGNWWSHCAWFYFFIILFGTWECTWDVQPWHDGWPTSHVCIMRAMDCLGEEACSDQQWVQHPLLQTCNLQLFQSPSSVKGRGNIQSTEKGYVL